MWHGQIIQGISNVRFIQEEKATSCGPQKYAGCHRMSLTSFVGKVRLTAFNHRNIFFLNMKWRSCQTQHENLVFKHASSSRSFSKVDKYPQSSESAMFYWVFHSMVIRILRLEQSPQHSKWMFWCSSLFNFKMIPLDFIFIPRTTFIAPLTMLRQHL